MTASVNYPWASAKARARMCEKYDFLVLDRGPLGIPVLVAVLAISNTDVKQDSLI